MNFEQAVEAECSNCGAERTRQPGTVCPVCAIGEMVPVEGGA